MCTTPATRFAITYNDIGGAACDPSSSYDPDPETALNVATDALLASASSHGYYWLDDGGSETNATQAVRVSRWCLSCPNPKTPRPRPTPPQPLLPSPLKFLLGSMPFRDIELLFGGSYFTTLEWLMEHVRLSLLTRSSWGAAKAVPWDVWLEHVLPYAALDEKRDVAWRWRPRFYELFFANASSYPSLYEAAESIAALIPSTSSEGVMVVNDVLVAGSPFTWKSSTAPAYLSPQQVAQTGASCTGTALVMLAAYRSVGIPARIAGCSNEYVDGGVGGGSTTANHGRRLPGTMISTMPPTAITSTIVVISSSRRSPCLPPCWYPNPPRTTVRYKNGAWVDDDHHWVEFYDATRKGPFSPSGGADDDDIESWHTKEGTSKGNAGGPWDSPSSSMNGCLAKMVPGDRMATLWSSSWSSPVFLPTMWHNDSWATTTGFVGGYNACGRYCSAWGCGNGTSMDQNNYYSQPECGPTSAN